MNFDEAFTQLLGHEGGFSDHKADPGGKTQFGITEAVASAHGFTGDTRTLTRDEAKIIAELNGAQGKPVDIGGYYMPDVAKLDAVMRPSATFNAAIAAA